MFQNDNCVTAFQIFFIEFQDLKIEKLLNHLFYRYFCYNFFFFFNLINSSIFQGEVKGSVGLSLEIAGILTYILWRRHGDKYHEYSNVQLFFSLLISSVSGRSQFCVSLGVGPLWCSWCPPLRSDQDRGSKRRGEHCSALYSKFFLLILSPNLAIFCSVTGTVLLTDSSFWTAPTSRCCPFLWLPGLLFCVKIKPREIFLLLLIFFSLRLGISQVYL